ncbi:hypothetical protein VTK56DRAFT_3578 [Thermocarpiscus australiensis]
MGIERDEDDSKREDTISPVTNRTGRRRETVIERTLQELWASVLNVAVDTISADDSFFRHGGDSIGAMRLVAAARQRGIVLAVASIFQNPKLTDMAKTATGSGVGNGKAGGNTGAVQAVVQDKPLTGPAEPFSLLRDKGGRSLQGLLEHAGLVAASQRQPDVANSEAILRTRILLVESIGFLQVVVQGEIAWIIAANASDLPENHRQLPPHDGGILSRYTIIGEHSSRPTFVWTVHHALYDGWSLPTLLSRVEARYRHPEAPTIPTPQYSRFVQYLSSIDVTRSDAFWTAKLSGSGTTAPQQFPQLPHPGHRIRATSQACRSVRFARPKGTDLTIASFLRAAWALVVPIYASSDDVVFGEVLNGRDVPVAGVEDLHVGSPGTSNTSFLSLTNHRTL